MTETQKNHLTSIFTHFGPIPKVDLEACFEICEVKELKKGDWIARRDQGFDYEVLVLQGVIRTFYLTYEGEEFNTCFFPDRSILSPWLTRTHQGNSLVDLQALEESEVAFMHQKTFEDLRYARPALREFGYRVVESDLLRRSRREVLMATKSAKDRYLAFRETFPGLENRISQFHIASYLGITPISLSRIRAAMVNP